MRNLNRVSQEVPEHGRDSVESNVNNDLGIFDEARAAARRSHDPAARLGHVGLAPT